MSPRITLTILQGPHQGQVLSFAESCRIVVGRADDCAIQIPKDMAYVDVSRHHCMFEINLPTIKVRDLGSLIGTFLNGVLIGKRTTRKSHDTQFPAPTARELRDGDEVQVGNTVFRVGIRVGEEALVPSFVPRELF